MIRYVLKGALRGFGEGVQTQNFDIYNINVVMIQTQDFLFFHNWINKLFLEENDFLRRQFEAREVAGSARYKQSKTVWKSVVL